MNYLKGGRIALGSACLMFAATVSCIPPGDDPPINPSILFSTGSQFLSDISTVALKGSIEIESARGRESGNFSAIISGIDSLFFLVEGPFKADLFTLITTGDSAFAKSRDMESWRLMKSSELLELPEYGIENLTPSDLGVYIFPQFYLERSGDTGRRMKLISKSDNTVFKVTAAGDQKSFILEREGSRIKASYKKALKFSGGQYPSEISVFDEYGNWQISIKIDRVRLNPKISPKIWRATK